jgi:alpha-tubulin suppressor-like RCC1 family protein
MQVVPGLGATTMVAAGALYPSVLALKADGTVWFWGADTLGESGDGGQVTSSVPLLVPIAATIRQVAAGDRYSFALDTNGDVWAWGDNSGGALSNTGINRSTAARTSVRNVQAIAAGGPGLVVYLQSDGTIRKAGAKANIGNNVDPIFVPGLANIVAIAAGEDTAYALRSDNTLFAFGGGSSGELGNNTTAFSTTPVAVQGITGAVSRIAAAKNRAGAVTADGKVWTWGAAPLGNGSNSGSATAVQVTGITDASRALPGRQHRDRSPYRRRALGLGSACVGRRGFEEPAASISDRVLSAGAVGRGGPRQLTGLHRRQHRPRLGLRHLRDDIDPGSLDR